MLASSANVVASICLGQILPIILFIGRKMKHDDRISPTTSEKTIINKSGMPQPTLSLKTKMKVKGAIIMVRSASHIISLRYSLLTKYLL